MCVCIYKVLLIRSIISNIVLSDTYQKMQSHHITSLSISVQANQW